MNQVYDVVIIGAGPAGLAAGLYAGRSKLKTLIIEKGQPGGQIATTHEVANYPGSIHFDGKTETSGPELIKRMVEQADEFNCERVRDNVQDIVVEDGLKVIKCKNNEYTAKTVILAPGAQPKKLRIPGEAPLTGKGVSYCATCDADFFEDLEVFVVGGSYSAVEEAMYLAKFARKVTMVVMLEDYDNIGMAVDKLKEFDNIEAMFNTQITAIEGDGMVERMKLINNKTNEEWVYEADEDEGMFGIFIFIGFDPNTEPFKNIVELDEWGYIKTDENMMTNVPGVYAAGDVRPKLLRQVVTAVSDGAIAATAALKFIEEMDH